MMRHALKDARPETLIPSARLRHFIGKRRNRRLLVVTTAMIFVGMLVLIGSDLPPSVALPALLLLGLFGCAHGVLLNLGTQFIAAKRPQDLDERQLSLWQGAHHRAYRILVGLLGVALVYVIVLGSTLGLPDTRLEWTVTVLALWMFAVILPSSLIYWSEPDILDDAPEVS
jgi:hypothetical protein